jgi:hypothetical protein
MFIFNDKIYTHKENKLSSHKNGMCNDCYNLYRNKLRNSTNSPLKKDIKINKLQEEIKELKNENKIVNKLLNELKNESKNGNKMVDNDLVELMGKSVKDNELNKNEFFLKLASNFLKNYGKGKGSRHDNNIIEWCLIIRYYGGSKTYNNIKVNLNLPSISTLNRYLPSINFGWINEIELGKLLNEWKRQIKSTKLVVAYDEFEIRRGLIFNKSVGKVIGFSNKQLDRNNFYNEYIENEKQIEENDIASKVIQFFITSFDGEITFPVGVFGHQNSHSSFVTSKIKELIDIFSKLDNEFKIKVTCSDGYRGNEVVSRNLKNQYGILHVYDYVHVLKRARNLLLNRNLKYPIGEEKVYFSINALRKLYLTNEKYKNLINDETTMPQDIMKWEPVKKLLNDELIENLIKEEEKSCVALGYYLKNLNNYYNLFRKLNETNEIKLERIDEIVKFLNDWKFNIDFKDGFINEELYEHITESILNMKYLLINNDDLVVSSINTLTVENYFGTIRAKIRKPSMMEYLNCSRMAWISLKSKLYQDSPYRVANSKKTGKYYNNTNLSIHHHQIEKPKNKIETKNDIVEGEKTVKEIDEMILENINEYLPKKNTLLLRELISKNLPLDSKNEKPIQRLDLVCPLEMECEYHKPFTYHRCLFNHLKNYHDLSIQECEEEITKSIFESIKTLNGGTSLSKDFESIVKRVVNKLSKSKINVKLNENMYNNYSIELVDQKFQFIKSMDNEKLIDKKIIIYDLEATDLIRNSVIPDITEICMIDLKNNSVYHQLFNPSKKVSSGAASVTGLTNSFLLKYPTVHEKINDIIEFIDNKSINNNSINNINNNNFNNTNTNNNNINNNNINNINNLMNNNNTLNSININNNNNFNIINNTNFNNTNIDNNTNNNNNINNNNFNNTYINNNNIHNNNVININNTNNNNINNINNNTKNNNFKITNTNNNNTNKNINNNNDNNINIINNSANNTNNYNNNNINNNNNTNMNNINNNNKINDYNFNNNNNNNINTTNNNNIHNINNINNNTNNNNTNNNNNNNINNNNNFNNFNNTNNTNTNDNNINKNTNNNNNNNNNNIENEIILIGHNSIRFDEKVLKYHLGDNIRKIKCQIKFIDSIELFKTKLDLMPKIKKYSKVKKEFILKPSLSLVDIHSHLFKNDEFDSHRAPGDTITLLNCLFKTFDNNLLNLVNVINNIELNKKRKLTFEQPNVKKMKHNTKCKCKSINKNGKLCGTMKCSCKKNGRLCSKECNCNCKQCENNNILSSKFNENQLLNESLIEFKNEYKPNKNNLDYYVNTQFNDTQDNTQYDDQVICKFENTFLSKEDVDILKNETSWINGSILYYFLKFYLHEKAFILPTYLSELKHSIKMEFFENWLIPININHSHWILAIIKRKNKIIVYDSMKKSINKEKQIENELNIILKKLNRNQFIQIQYNYMNEQNDGYSCGTFVIKYALQYFKMCNELDVKKIRLNMIEHVHNFTK